MTALHSTTGRAARRATSAVTAIGVALAFGVATTGQASADHGTGTTDRAAYALDITGTILDEGPFPAGCAEVATTAGDCTDTTIRTPDPLDPLASVGIFSAETAATSKPLAARSSATVVDLTALPDTPLTVTADVVESECSAEVAGGRPVLDGTSTVAGLTIGGQPIEVPGPGEPQVIEVPLDALGTVTVAFNEQIVTERGSQLVVNAVHITADLLPDTPLAIFQDIVIASSQCSVHPTDGGADPDPDPGPGPGGGTGFIEICAVADNSSGAVRGAFRYRFAGKTVRVPVGTCSAPKRAPAGSLAVTQVKRDGYRMSACRTQPVQRLKHCNPRERKSVVRIVEGGVRQETTLFVTNKRPVPGPNRGSVKVCKIAGNGVAVGTRFRFSVGGKGVTVPAGPAKQGGYCKLVRDFVVGSKVRVTEVARPGVRVSRIAVQPAGRKVGSSTANRTTVVRVGRGFTVASFTNTRS